jgi:hypothetical protein
VLAGGFAFERQMWFEVSLADAARRELASSGVLAHPTDELCDAGDRRRRGEPNAPPARGSATADAELVNFQQMLVDKVDPARDEHDELHTSYRGHSPQVRYRGSAVRRASRRLRSRRGETPRFPYGFKLALNGTQTPDGRAAGRFPPTKTLNHTPAAGRRDSDVEPRMHGKLAASDDG